MKHVLFFFFLALASGIALGRSEFFAQTDPQIVAVTVVCLLILSWVAAGSRRVYAVCIAASCLLIGALLALTSSNLLLEKKWEAAVGPVEKSSVMVEGMMTEGRRSWTDAYGRERYSFTLSDVRRAGGGENGTTVHLPGRIRVSGIGGKSGSALKLPAYGDRVRVAGTLAIPGGRTNPAGFDWRRFLMTRGTFAVMRAENLENLGPRHGFWGGVFALREKLIRAMDRTFTPGTSDIAKAIFLGERSELDPDFRRSLVNTGTLHLFAISGFNVGFVALILFGFFALLRIPNPAKSLTVLVLLILYAVLVGDNSPVVRAVIMAACLIAADLSKTRVSSLQGLGFAGLWMLVLNPEECFDPAFQLSFAAVAGLALIVPMWGTLEDVRRARSDRRAARWRAVLTLTVLTSLAAWVTTAPILIHHFNRFSFVAPVINVLLVPIAFVLNLLLVIFSVVACAAPPLAGLLRAPIEANVWALKGLVDVFDRLPGASWNLASWSIGTWAALAAWWAWLAFHRQDVRRRLRVGLSVVVLLSLIMADGVRVVAAAPPLRVTYFDAGQANAALVELRTTRILIDAGRGGDADAAARILVPYLASIGASRVDAVFITHPQFDHAGGLEGLLRDVAVGGIWINGDRADAAFFRRILRTARARHVPVRTVKRGDRILGLPGEVRLKVLHPSPYFPGGDDLNERSLVLLFEARGKKLLWTGDIGEVGLSELLLSEKFTPVDILQVPHHGSKTGVNEIEFLSQTHPNIALISCGRENSYGHPHPSTLEALSQTASSVHRTDLNGALQLTVDQHGTTLTPAYHPTPAGGANAFSGRSRRRAV